MAYMLRLQGRDVTAMPTYNDKRDYLAQHWDKSYNGLTERIVGYSSNSMARTEIEKAMLNHGDGAVGMIRFSYKDEETGEVMGHAFAVENVNGNVRFVDAQQNIDAKSYFDEPKFYGFEWGRIDDLKPAPEIMQAVKDYDGTRT